MIGVLVRAAGLTSIYLLVLTSLAPGDIAIGAVLGLALAARLRPRHGSGAGARLSARGVLMVLGETAAEMVRGTARVVVFCLGGTASPGLVEIPRGDRSRVETGLWGVLTGEAPDEVVVEVDEERGVLVVHVLDARDPEAVRERHRRTHDRLCGRSER